MSIILGVNSFHADSAACLLIDGRLVGAVAEERLGRRIKHTSRFPENAIRWLLEENGVRVKDLTHLAVPRDSAANRLAKATHIARNPLEGARAVAEHYRRQQVTQDYFAQIPKICDVDPADANFEIVNVEHHLAHVASSYFVSPFDGLTAGFSYDASGDFVSAMAARCEGNKIRVLDKVALPHSLGFFYTALCHFIGFDQFGEEYKVMGLAPYGEDRYRDEIQKLVSFDDSSWFRIATAYFKMHSGGASDASDEVGRPTIDHMFSDKMTELLGPARRRTDDLTQREWDIARSTQIRFEEAAVHCLSRLHKKIPTCQLAMAGGCALNGVANARILRETPFEVPYLQPASSDDGTCIGAAYVVWHHVLGQSERFHMEHAFWGPDYSEEAIRMAILESGFSFESCASNEELTEMAAGEIASGKVVGWYQGRSEWGPRALGNRSILANPALPNVKDLINSKIKRRESFRPFAPSVLKEDVPLYFEQDVYSPFMMHVVKIKPEWRKLLPGITHVDGTGRLQSVDPASNALYHQLIKKFKNITGIGIVLNTSFNENEPVVDTPQQAIDCFRRTEMDILCLGRNVLRKAD